MTPQHYSELTKRHGQAKVDAFMREVDRERMRKDPLARATNWAMDKITEDENEKNPFAHPDSRNV